MEANCIEPTIEMDGHLLSSASRTIHGPCEDLENAQIHRRLVYPTIRVHSPPDDGNTKDSGATSIPRE